MWRAVLALLIACSLTLPAAQATPAEPAPEFLPLEEFDLTQLRQRVVYLEFWTSWCSLCRKSFPWLSQMQRDYREDGLVVVAINLNKKRFWADRFIRKNLAEFVHYHDPKRSIADQFNVHGVPSVILIDRKGKIRMRYSGYKKRHLPKLEQAVGILLQE